MRSTTSSTYTNNKIISNAVDAIIAIIPIILLVAKTKVKINIDININIKINIDTKPTKPTRT